MSWRGCMWGRESQWTAPHEEHLGGQRTVALKSVPERCGQGDVGFCGNNGALFGSFARWRCRGVAKSGPLPGGRPIQAWHQRQSLWRPD
eukprot:250721-Chlamydomonas_euryale.AAC.1